MRTWTSRYSKGATIAVIGYGIQGKVQAANARDSGCTVIVGTRPPEAEPVPRPGAGGRVPVDEHRRRHEEGGRPPDRAGGPGAARASTSRDIAPHLRAGQTLCFCHGFNVLYGAIRPPENVNTVLFVPNAPGAFVREKYKKGEGVYGCVSVEHDATGKAREIALAIAKAVGSTRAGVVELSFQHETEGDNFEEQILYGGAIQLMRLCFQVMVDNGYSPSFAYAKAVRSLRSVLDVMDENGIENYLTGRCSRTCEFAVRTRGPRVINEEAVRQIFRETEQGVLCAGLDAGVGAGHAAAPPDAPHGGGKPDGEDRAPQWRKDFGK